MGYFTGLSQVDGLYTMLKADEGFTHVAVILSSVIYCISIRVSRDLTLNCHGKSPAPKLNGSPHSTVYHMKALHIIIRNSVMFFSKVSHTIYIWWASGVSTLLIRMY